MLNRKKMFRSALMASTVIASSMSYALDITTDVTSTQFLDNNNSTLRVSPGDNDGGTLDVFGLSHAVVPNFASGFFITAFPTTSQSAGGFTIRSNDGNIIENTNLATTNITLTVQEHAKIGTTGAGHVFNSNKATTNTISNSGEIVNIGTGNIFRSVSDTVTNSASIINNETGKMTTAKNVDVIAVNTDGTTPAAGTGINITNSGTMSTSGTGRVVAYGVNATAGSVTNSGYMNSDVQLGTAVLLSGAATPFFNSGTVTGLNAIQTTGNVTNIRGTFNGNIITTANNALEMTGGVINGKVDVIGAVKTTININQDTVSGQTATFNGNINSGVANTAMLLKLKSSAIINGNINNYDITISDGASLTLNGLMTSTLANNEALVLAAGTSTNTLKISKSLNVPGVFTMNGVNNRLQLTLNDKTNFSSISSGNVATLNGNISVSLGTGYIFNGDTFKIIQSTGPIVNNGATFILPNSAVLAFTQTLNPTDIILSVARKNLVTIANSHPIASGIAQEMDRLGATFTPPGYVSALRALEGLATDGQVIDALVQMAPRSDGSVLRGVINGQHLAHETITKRLVLARNDNGDEGDVSGYAAGGYNAGHSEPMMVWVEAYGNSANQDLRRFTPGYRAKTLGAAFGLDKAVLDNMRLGFSLNHGTTNTRVKLLPETSNQIQSWGGSLYGSYEMPCSYIDAMLSYASNMIHTVKRIRFGTTSQVMDSEHRGSQISTRLTYGMPILQKTDKEGWAAGASISAMWDRAKERSFTERNLTGLVLRVNRVIDNSAMLKAQTKLDYYYGTELGVLIPSIKVGASYDVVSVKPEVIAAFMPGGASFKSVGAKRSRIGGYLGLGALLVNNSNTKIDLSYDLESRRNYLSHTGLLTMRYAY